MEILFRGDKPDKQQGKLDTGGKFSYFPVAVVDLDTFGLYNVKRKSEFDGGKKGE